MPITRIANNKNCCNKVIFPKLSYKLGGFLFKTHNELGRFCNEKQYGDFMERLLRESNTQYEREKILPASFQGERTGRNKVDFLIEDKIVLELKAKRILSREEYYQTRRYLEALNLKLAVLVNFREKYLKPRRILNSNVR
jgi:GxxExxY protein